MKTLLLLAPATLALTTCQDFIDVLDKQFCKDRPDGNYPVNDDTCSLFYNCWQGQTFCESCSEQTPNTPKFVYREDDWGLCTKSDDPAALCPTPGFPDNAINDRPETTTAESTKPTEAPVTIPSDFTTCEANKESFNSEFCENRPDGNYPYNDENCSLFYNCWNEITTCQSCDVISQGTQPYFTYRENDWGICAGQDDLPLSWTCPDTSFDNKIVPYNSTFITCEDYADVFDESFCKDRQDGTYPFNDDSCSLYYDCFEGNAFCQSCDLLSEGVTPQFIYTPELEFNSCGFTGDAKCPTNGFKDNAKNERPEPEPTEEPQPTDEPEPTVAPTETPGNFTRCDEYKSVLDYDFCKDRENGLYPVNDENCSLYYNCWEQETSCGSCDFLTKGTLPAFVYTENNGYCEVAGVQDCPVEGFPVNRLD